MASSSVPISKWQLAILIGTPIAVGCAFYAYYKSTNKFGKDDDEQKKGGTSINSNGKTVSKKESTPLELATTQKNEGNVCFRNGKFDEAIKYYDKAIEMCPKDQKMDLAIFYQNRAAAYEMLKKWNQVKADCSKSLEYNPRYVKAYFRRAKAHEATKDYLDCLDDITATCILEVFQNNASIMFADRVLKQTGYNYAIEAMKNRTLQLPSTVFIKAYFRSFAAHPLKDITFNEIPENPTGFIKAKLAFDNGNFNDIIAACTDEINLSEGESQYKIEATLLRGTFNLLRGDFNQASEDLNSVINNVDADNNLRVNSLLVRASLYIQTEDKDKGLADFDTAEKLNPKNPDIYHQRAQIYTLLDELNVAVKQYDKAVELAPENGIAMAQKCYAEYRLAFIQQNHNSLLNCMENFKMAVKKYPNCFECYSLMAQVLTDQGQYAEADTYFEKAIALAPDNSPLYVHRGIMYLQWTANMEKALELINQSIEVDGKCELAYETLGTIEVQRGNLQRAVELFEKAITYAKGKTEMVHLYSLRNAAIAQINVTKKLGIDISAISALASGVSPT